MIFIFLFYCKFIESSVLIRGSPCSSVAKSGIVESKGGSLLKTSILW
jgi:hypothetical protein